jgi:hypothetical protein
MELLPAELRDSLKKKKENLGNHITTDNSSKKEAFFTLSDDG